MVLKIKHFVVFATFAIFYSCGEQQPTLKSIEGKQLVIDSSLTSKASIESFVKPYRERVDQVLDSTLAYAPYPISKTDGALNTTAGNLMADIVLWEADPIFKSRTGHHIDFVLLNHGGIRSLISKGNVSSRTAYEVMPFENAIVVAELKGASLLKMASYLRDSGRAHPISGLQLTLDPQNEIHSISIQGKPLDENKTYYVATSNYLVNGGDSMFFFKEALNITNTDYLIRNAMIDYFKKVDTLKPVVDDRFIKLSK
ncbi:5'-nucleotidase [Zobellia galactanivorans]|uniref:5'nucleotidase, substrate binding subunit n=1 Tax=Zobellia galactanivorans (strain DSM 12802 / CCUG 47099 / CIP 106680 / NCIMB 13871 / Dsij) TaxID=63186 RepID=G0L753_ZOBGA|nr:5'-nucleotidase [Zobellia galactanivorans]MDO6807982.1 5'-nucleotidase [Zobellia galactanivorans]CAZ98906.1 5'nucleotidase, substrate binding subunit [Zobellia galactanivorans]